MKKIRSVWLTSSCGMGFDLGLGFHTAVPFEFRLRKEAVHNQGGEFVTVGMVGRSTGEDRDDCDDCDNRDDS